MEQVEQTLTEQEIFDHVINFMRKQKVGSIVVDTSTRLGARCYYRNENGTQCAVGCLLTDEECSVTDIEEMTVHTLMVKGLLPKRLVPHTSFLAALQSSHDNSMPFNVGDPMDKWEFKMKGLAHIYSLKYSSPVVEV